MYKSNSYIFDQILSKFPDIYASIYGNDEYGNRLKKDFTI
jgi:hypothetical protein